MDEFISLSLRVLEFPLAKIGASELTVLGLFKFMCLIAVVFLTESLLRRYITRRLLQRTQLQPSLQYGISRILGYVFIALGIYVALNIIGLDLSALAFVAGGLGVGLAFGLQNIVSNFVSGLIILAERPIAIGDRVEVDGVAGQVTKISLRSTTIITNDNISIIVPNSNFITNKVINWSHGDTRIQIRLAVGVAYGTDLPKLRKALLEVAENHPKVLREPPPNVFFVGFGESALDFELGVWTSEMTHAPRRFRSELFFAIEQKLREHHIEIPFPQRDLHIRSGLNWPAGAGGEGQTRIA